MAQTNIVDCRDANNGNKNIQNDSDAKMRTKIFI